jgi:Fur family transcriptional regulator, ferric uptake regulator
MLVRSVYNSASFAEGSLVSHHPLPDLSSFGYRRTPQRRLLWDVLHQQGPYLTAEEIHQFIQAQSPEFNKTTVYRILASLRDVGLVQEMQARKGPCRYAAAVDYHGGPQLVCDACGIVVEIEDSELSQRMGELTKSYGFELTEGIDVVVFARCGSCAKSSLSDSDAVVTQGSR